METILPIMLGLFFVTYILDRRASKSAAKKDVWAGIVEEIEIRELVEPETHVEYTETVLHFRKDDGERDILHLDELEGTALFDELASLGSGERIIKADGDEFPRAVSDAD